MIKVTNQLHQFFDIPEPAYYVYHCSEQGRGLMF